MGTSDSYSEYALLQVSVAAGLRGSWTVGTLEAKSWPQK